ncbi:hypothetical protein R50073_23640 [Maricurvus nonylphenolicus]|uniref:hypothetical protein n=1 Tax=Maricurvus nonylphenolicus TaxID=1008307 RepID=UPI0036F39265
MNKLLLTIAFVALIATAYVGLKPRAQHLANENTSLPWEITLSGTGYSQVFGIDIGQSTLSETATLLGVDHEIAIISDQEDNSALELYAAHYQSGPLSAKLIVGFRAEDDLLLAMKERADHKEYMASGSRKFLLSEEDLHRAQGLIVRSVSFIPGARLNQEIVESRFGKPSQVVKASETETHYLYPEQGLDIVLNSDAKDRLQYVAPKDFDLLLAPLQSAK